VGEAKARRDEAVAMDLRSAASTWRSDRIGTTKEQRDVARRCEALRQSVAGRFAAAVLLIWARSRIARTPDADSG
jgi:hypothetical protein